MPVTVRPMRDEEARGFLELQRGSVRGLAGHAYPSVVIDAWAPLPVTDAAVQFFRLNLDEEIRLIAESDGKTVGIGALVVATSELRACYVAPWTSRRGVGTALVAEIERIARAKGLSDLSLKASVNAEPFYTALGYEVETRGEHVLSSGVHMATIAMRKSLRS
jgi:putative acetyltransferase